MPGAIGWAPARLPSRGGVIAHPKVQSRNSDSARCDWEIEEVAEVALLPVAPTLRSGKLDRPVKYRRFRRSNILAIRHVAGGYTEPQVRMLLGERRDRLGRHRLLAQVVPLVHERALLASPERHRGVAPAEHMRAPFAEERHATLPLLLAQAMLRDVIQLSTCSSGASAIFLTW